MKGYLLTSATDIRFWYILDLWILARVCFRSEGRTTQAGPGDSVLEADNLIPAYYNINNKLHLIFSLTKIETVLRQLCYLC